MEAHLYVLSKDDMAVHRPHVCPRVSQRQTPTLLGPPPTMWVQATQLRPLSVIREQGTQMPLTEQSTQASRGAIPLPAFPCQPTMRVHTAEGLGFWALDF